MIRLLLCAAALAATRFTLGSVLDSDEHVYQSKSDNRRAVTNDFDLEFAQNFIKGNFCTGSKTWYAMVKNPPLRHMLHSGVMALCYHNLPLEGDALKILFNELKEVIWTVKNESKHWVKFKKCFKSAMVKGILIQALCKGYNPLASPGLLANLWDEICSSVTPYSEPIDLFKKVVCHILPKINEDDKLGRMILLSLKGEYCSDRPKRQYDEVSMMHTLDRAVCQEGAALNHHEVQGVTVLFIEYWCCLVITL